MLESVTDKLFICRSLLRTAKERFKEGRYRNYDVSRSWNRFRDSQCTGICEKEKGCSGKEPSVVAFDRDTNVIKAISEEARLMLGRTPGNIIAVRPLRQGVISDYTVTEKMIKYFVQKLWENVHLETENQYLYQVVLQK